MDDGELKKRLAMVLRNTVCAVKRTKLKMKEHPAPDAYYYYWQRLYLEQRGFVKDLVYIWKGRRNK